MNLEQIDRRLFLRGLTLTSAGLLVPKKTWSTTRIPEIKYLGLSWSGQSHLAEYYFEGHKNIVVLDSFIDVLFRKISFTKEEVIRKAAQNLSTQRAKHPSLWYPNTKTWTETEKIKEKLEYKRLLIQHGLDSDVINKETGEVI